MESAPGYRGRVEGEVGAGWDEMQARGVASAERQMLGCRNAGLPRLMAHGFGGPQ